MNSIMRCRLNIDRSPLHIIFDASENYVKVMVEETNTESDLNLNIFSKFKPFSREVTCEI